MERMKMHSRDNVARNVEAVGRLFPNALTEVMRDGKFVQAIDFDVLRQELSREIVEGARGALCVHMAGQAAGDPCGECADYFYPPPGGHGQCRQRWHARRF